MKQDEMRYHMKMVLNYADPKYKFVVAMLEPEVGMKVIDILSETMEAAESHIKTRTEQGIEEGWGDENTFEIIPMKEFIEKYM